MANDIKKNTSRRIQSGIFIPLSFWLSDQYSILEKVLLIEIQRNSQIKNANLASICQCSESSTTKIIKKLTGDGILSYIGKGEERLLSLSPKFIQGIFKNGGFNGVWIPISLWETHLISPLLKFLIIEIFNLDNGDGCKENNNYFSDFLQISPTQASRHLSNLSQLGLISTETIKGNRHIYLNSDLSAVFASDVQTYISHIKQPNNAVKRANIGAIFNALFSEFWGNYPNKRNGDLKAREKYYEVLNMGVSHDQVMEKLSYRMLSSQWEGGHVPLASAWLSQEFISI